MHLTLIFGGWIILLIGMPIGALVVLVLLKTAVDLRAHQREHRATRKPNVTHVPPNPTRPFDILRAMKRGIWFLAGIVAIVALALPEDGRRAGTTGA